MFSLGQRKSANFSSAGTNFYRDGYKTTRKHAPKKSSTIVSLNIFSPLRDDGWFTQ
jgi:hypothetical protein